jgi:DNA-binding transcriptional regulator YdaS (Cro superfamily)
MCGMNKKVTEAINLLDGVTSVSRLCGVKPPSVWEWKQRGSIPIEHCATIERATGGAVTRKDLRPDDWARIWPELDDSHCSEPVEDAA